MTSRKIEVDVNDRFKLVCDLNEVPYDKELDIYLVDTALLDCQDIAKISPEYKYGEDGNVQYGNNKISVKLFTDKDDEDFTKKYSIPIRCVETEEELTISEILDIEEIEVEQNIHDVLQYELMDMNRFVSNGEINLDDSKNYSFSPTTDYGAARFDYTLKRKGDVVLECVSSEDVKNYINDILKNYKVKK